MARSPMGTKRSFLPLPWRIEDRAAFEVQIEQFQVDEFRPPYPRRVEHFQDGAVAQSDGIGNIRLHHHLLGFGSREHVFRETMAQAWQFDFRGRVVQDAILPRHPAEPRAQRHQARVLAAEGQRIAALLAVVEQVPLVAFENRPGYFRWLGQSTLAAPR